MGLVLLTDTALALHLGTPRVQADSRLPGCWPYSQLNLVLARCCGENAQLFISLLCSYCFIQCFWCAEVLAG